MSAHEEKRWSLGSIGLAAAVDSVLENARHAAPTPSKRAFVDFQRSARILEDTEQEARDELCSEYFTFVSGVQQSVQAFDKAFKMVRICCVLRYSPAIHNTDDPYKPKHEHYYIYQPPKKKAHLGSVYHTTICPHNTDLTTIGRIFSRKWKKELVMTFENHAGGPAGKHVNSLHPETRVLRKNNSSDMMDLFWNKSGGKAIAKHPPKLPQSHLPTKYLIGMVKELATPEKNSALPPPLRVQERVPHSLNKMMTNNNFKNFKTGNTLGLPSFNILSPSQLALHNLSTPVPQLDKAFTNNLMHILSKNDSSLNTTFNTTTTSTSSRGTPNLHTAQRRKQQLTQLAESLHADLTELAREKTRKKSEVAAPLFLEEKPKKTVLSTADMERMLGRLVTSKNTNKGPPTLPQKSLNAETEAALMHRLVGRTTQSWERRVAPAPIITTPYVTPHGVCL